MLGRLQATSNAARRDADAFQRQRNFCDGPVGAGDVGTLADRLPVGFYPGVGLER